MANSSGDTNRPGVSSGRDNDRRLASSARLTIPRWVLIGLLIYAALMSLAAVSGQIINISLISRQHAQEAQFCKAEREIRAKITEIEIELKTYVYVFIPPGCHLSFLGLVNTLRFGK